MSSSNFFDGGRHQHEKTWAGSNRGQNKQEERRRPDEKTLPEGEWTSAQHSVKSTQRALVKEREQSSNTCQQGYEFVQLMFKHQERRQLAQLAVAQHNGYVFEA